ncbi:MATE family efflux transporter [Fenollaria massiliensis]|uniref:MATE family efflux transporter n=1 Tax=Fenollaria massiliensis TaxID=938288 RepID=UPI002418420C|nr:MATE family efflux transporter [Fenollaria massiliensis]
MPSLSAMIIFSLYSMVDGFFVSKYVGVEALSAVNLSMPFINIVFALGIIAAVGSQTMCGVFIGRKNYMKANKIFSFNIKTVTIFSIILTVLFYFNMDTIARLLGATEELGPLVIEYLGHIVYFVPFLMISYNFEVMVKVDGFPRLAVATVITCGLSNVILDYVFVGLMGHGLAGAAVATGISQVISTVVYLIHFTVGKSNLEFVEVKFSFDTLKSIFSLGVGDFVSEVGIAMIVLFYNIFIIKFLGEKSIATFSVISYVNNLALTCFAGITQGTQPLLSYYYGKKDYDSLKKLFRLATAAIFVTGVVFLAASQLFPERIFRIFLDVDKETLSYSVESLRKFSISFMITGFNVLIAAVCVSFLKPKYSVTINILRSFVTIYLALFVLTMLEPTLIWFASALSEGVTLIFAYYFYRRLSRENQEKYE